MAYSEKAYARRRAEVVAELTAQLLAIPGATFTPEQIEDMAIAGAVSVMDREQAARDSAERAGKANNLRRTERRAPVYGSRLLSDERRAPIFGPRGRRVTD